MYEFKWWMVIAPLLLAGVTYLGVAQYTLVEKIDTISNERNLLIRRRFDDKVLIYASRIATLIVGIMFICSSGGDVVRMLNDFPIQGENDILTIIGVPFIVIFVVGGYSFVCYSCAKIASWTKYGFAHEQLTKIMADCKRYGGKHTKHSSILG